MRVDTLLLSVALVMAMPFINLAHSAESQHKSHKHHKSHEHHSAPSTRTMDIQNGWVRAVPPVSKNSAAYFTLTNRTGKADTLLNISSTVAKDVSLHRTVKKQGASRMLSVSHVALKPGETLTLEPGGYHVMLMGLKQPLKEGAAVTIELLFQHAGKVSTTMPVRKGLDSNTSSGHHHHHH